MGKLRFAQVEYKICLVCGTEYEGSRCPRCENSFDPNTMRRVIHDRLILVGTDPPAYEQKQRRRCTNKKCENLNDPSKDCCPMCDGRASQRITTVWVRTFNHIESLEELQNRELMEAGIAYKKWTEGIEIETETEEVNDNVEQGEHDD